MTFVVAFATPRFAVVASDRRRWSIESGVTSDDGRKLHRVRGGWLVGGGYVGPRQAAFEAIGCIGADPEAIGALLQRLRRELVDQVCRMPRPPDLADPADAAWFWLACRRNGAFAVFEGNWYTGAWGPAPELLNACNPSGWNPWALGRLLSERERELGSLTAVEARPWVQQLFAAVREPLGEAGSVGPDVDIEVLTAETLFDANTGKPKRDSAYLDGKYAMKASDTAGKETDDDLFISSTKTLKVGTVASPASLTKTLRVHHGEFVPASDTTTWFLGAIFLRPNTLNTQMDFVAPVVLPKGVTITQISARMLKAVAGDLAEVKLVRVDSDSSTLLATATLTTTGSVWTTVSASLSQLVGDEAYTLNAALTAVSNVNDARLQFVEIQYTMPDYSKGY